MFHVFSMEVGTGQGMGYNKSKRTIYWGYNKSRNNCIGGTINRGTTVLISGLIALIE